MTNNLSKYINLQKYTQKINTINKSIRCRLLKDKRTYSCYGAVQKLCRPKGSLGLLKCPSYQKGVILKLPRRHEGVGGWPVIEFPLYKMVYPEG